MSSYAPIIAAAACCSVVSIAFFVGLGIGYYRRSPFSVSWNWRKDSSSSLLDE